MTLAHLQSYKIISTFATLDKQGLRVCNVSTHSSMDRIPDSGSDDWGSTPHGCTNLKAIFYFNTLKIKALKAPTLGNIYAEGNTK